jgi:hypothetical protein
VLLPLPILLLGLWEGQRGTEDWAAFAAERDRLAAIVTDPEARAPRDGRPDYRLQFRHNGQNYGAPLRRIEGARPGTEPARSRP